jgi:hypothetical protein
VTSLHPRRSPVPRTRVLAAFLLSLLVLVALGAMTELLRHPAPDGGPVVDGDAEDEEGGDPRDPVVCPEPAPREGAEETGDVDVPDGLAVDSNVLYDCPSTFDGAMVRYSGEVIGDVLWRRDGAWVQLNDDVYADALGPLPAHRDYRGGNAGVGVFIPRALAEQIAFVGDHDNHGDVIDVIGTFHRVDPISTEVAIIRARTGEVARPGRPFPHAPLRDRQLVAGILVPLAIAALLWERRSNRRL